MPPTQRRPVRIALPLALSLALVAATGTTGEAGILLLSLDPAPTATSMTGNTFDLILSNQGMQSVSLSAFSIGLKTATAGVAFTDATNESSGYVFGANGLGSPSLATNVGDLPGTFLLFGDVLLSGPDIVLEPLGRVSLGRVYFDDSGYVSGTMPIDVSLSTNTIFSNLANSSGDITGTITALGNNTWSLGPVPSVPEPSSIVTVTTGLSILGRLLRRRGRGTTAEAGASTPEAKG